VRVRDFPYLTSESDKADLSSFRNGSKSSNHSRNSSGVITAVTVSSLHEVGAPNIVQKCAYESDNPQTKHSGKS
jgi:hypothetical protein